MGVRGKKTQKEFAVQTYFSYLGQLKRHGTIKFQTILPLINNAARTQITGSGA